MASTCSEDRPDPAAALHERITRLEEKACFTDDLVDTLNALVAQQQAQIALLARALQRLRQQPADESEPEFRSLRDELPPHY